jgi:hypothetical protein
LKVGFEHGFFSERHSRARGNPDCFRQSMGLDTRFRGYG